MEAPTHIQRMVLVQENWSVSTFLFSLMIPCEQVLRWRGLMPSASFCVRCVCLIPYFLACVCLCFLGCVEWLARHVCEPLSLLHHDLFIDYSIRLQCLPCVSFNDSEFLSSRMHAEFARQLNVSTTYQSIWRSVSLLLC